MTDVTPTDRPKSVRNRCVIGILGGVFVLPILQVAAFSVGIGPSQISIFFSFPERMCADSKRKADNVQFPFWLFAFLRQQKGGAYNE